MLFFSEKYYWGKRWATSYTGFNRVLKIFGFESFLPPLNVFFHPPPKKNRKTSYVLNRTSHHHQKNGIFSKLHIERAIGLQPFIWEMVG